MGKSASSLLRSWLPRPLIRGAAELAASRQRRRYEKLLPDATSTFARAYEEYWRSGAVPANADEMLFLAAWESGGTFPSSCMQRQAPPFQVDRFRDLQDHLLAHLDPVATAAAVDETGYFVLPEPLDAAVVEEVLGVLEAGPAYPRGDGLGARPPEAPSPSAPTWWMRPEHTVRSAAVRQLLKERRLAETAGRYLGVDPMIMSVVLWKSFSWSAPDKKSAQLFHYDNDRAGFLKMFLYLTDVSEVNGPHVYVARSHRQKPRELLHGGRLSDLEVASHYPPDEWRIITGAKGTMFFADTRGFHKGGHLLEGERAMFQINLASDRFGIFEEPIGPATEAPDDLERHVRLLPRYYSQIYVPHEVMP